MRKLRSEYPSEQADKFLLRMPDGMRDRIRAAAEANNRSMNAEIIAVLEMYYPPEPPPEEMANLIEGLFRMYNGNPPKEQWNKLYRLLSEFQARLVREKLRDNYGDAAAVEFDQGRLSD